MKNLKLVICLVCSLLLHQASSDDHEKTCDEQLFTSCVKYKDKLCSDEVANQDADSKKKAAKEYSKIWPAQDECSELTPASDIYYKTTCSEGKITMRKYDSDTCSGDGTIHLDKNNREWIAEYNVTCIEVEEGERWALCDGNYTAPANESDNNTTDSAVSFMIGIVNMVAIIIVFN